MATGLIGSGVCKKNQAQNQKSAGLWKEYFMKNKKKRIEFLDIAAVALMLDVLVGVAIFVCMAMDIGSKTFYTMMVRAVVILTVVIIAGSIKIMNQNRRDKKQILNNRKNFQDEYDAYVNKMGIIKSTRWIDLIQDYDGRHVSISHYLWVSQGILHMFPRTDHYMRYYLGVDRKPDISMLHQVDIPIDSILYYEEIGELRRYSIVSGGEITLNPILLRRAVREGNVATIAAHRAPVKTRIVSEDDRVVELLYKNQDGEIENLEFQHGAYAVFRELIPFKEMRKMIALERIEENRESPGSEASASKSTTARQKLDELMELKEAGMITEEEYADQRQRILNSI